MDGPAMVQIIENWTMADAVVVAAPQPADLPDFDSVDLRIDRADAVEGYANLLGDTTGKTLTVLAPRAKLAGLCAGQPLRLRLRREPGRVFAHPDMIERR